MLNCLWLNNLKNQTKEKLLKPKHYNLDTCVGSRKIKWDFENSTTVRHTRLRPH